MNHEDTKDAKIIDVQRQFKIATGIAMLNNSKAREQRFRIAEAEALSEGDQEGAWFAKAARAATARFIEKLERDLAALRAEEAAHISTPQ